MSAVKELFSRNRGTMYNYKPMTTLEMGEAFMSYYRIETKLEEMGYRKAQITQIINSIDTGGEDAYIPMLIQRRLDTSNRYTLLPFKVRTKKWLNRHGVPIPSMMPDSDPFIYIPGVLMYVISEDLPEIFIFLPIAEISIGVWRIKPNIEQEFLENWSYFTRPGIVREILISE